MRDDQIVLLMIYAFVRNSAIFLNQYGRKILTASLIAGTIAVLGFLIARDWDTLRKFQWHIRPLLLALALGCHAASLAGTFVAWKLIMNHLGSPAGIKTDFQIYFLSLAARKIPSAIWYTGTRLFLYVQEGVGASLILTAVALEFIIAVLTGGWAFVAFRTHYLFVEHYEWVGHGVLVLTLLLTALLVIRPRLFIRWARHRRAWQKNHLPLSMPERRCLLICFAIYLAAWFVGGTSFYLTIYALIPSPGINWSNAVGIATLSTLVALLGTVLPIGVWLKELTAGMLLNAWLPLPVGLAVAVVYRILQMLDELLWIGGAYLLLPKAPKRKLCASDNPKGVLHELPNNGIL